MDVRRHLALVAVLSLLLAGADLAAKTIAVALRPQDVLHHARSPLLLLGAVACAALVVLVAHVRSLPLDVAAAALVGGCLGNLASLLAWRRGVPDFVAVGGIVITPADALIWVGISGLLLTAGLLAVRHRRATLR